VLYGPGDVRFEECPDPTIVAPTDAIIRLAATCICGSDLWDYRGINPVRQPRPMGHEYCGIVEEVGSAVGSIRPGQFVIGSFFASDNTCPNCQAATSRRACIGSSSAGRRLPGCACLLRTAPWWPPRNCHRTI
jgi:threonine dehydrogenase-like Zn-dependent dehydrogenase